MFIVHIILWHSNMMFSNYSEVIKYKKLNVFSQKWICWYARLFVEQTFIKIQENNFDAGKHIL